MPDPPAPIVEFLADVRRRRLLMGSGGTVALALGSLGLVTVAGGATPVLAVVALLGGLLVVGSLSGSVLLRDARVLATGSPQTLELMSWPYRAIRSPVRNRLLITLDVPGSTSRAPLAEFTAVWHTSKDADAPARRASVYGSLGVGGTGLAVDDSGRCYLGRVERSRAGDSTRWRRTSWVPTARSSREATS